MRSTDLIVAHDVTNVGHDRDQLSNMAGQAKPAMGVEALDVLADRDYFKARARRFRGRLSLSGRI